MVVEVVKWVGQVVLDLVLVVVALSWVVVWDLVVVVEVWSVRPFQARETMLML